MYFTKYFAKKTADNTIKMPRRGFFNRGSTRVNEDTSMQVSAFNRGVIYIATQIAKLPWEVKDKDNKIVDGAIANLLSLAPNSEMNAFMFRLMMVGQAIIKGNAYAEIERSTNGTPLAMWPLRSDDVDLLRTTSGELVYRVTSAGANGVSNEPVYLQPKDVFHVRNFHTKDGLVGQGVVAYAIETLGITLAADQMASGIFHNGGIPSGVLTHPGTLSDAAYKRLKDSWDAQNGGRKAGGTSILEEGATYTAINVDPETLQFLQSRQFSVLEMARFLGVPPTKLFDVTAATYSNVENANLEVATDTLDAWAVNFEMEADVKLLSNRFNGRFTELDLYSVFRGDMKTRADYFKALMSVGAITPNQIRAREGMAPYKEGDNYYIATNNFTPVNRMDEVIDAEIESKKKPPAPATPAKPATKDDLQEAAIRFLNK